MGTDHQHVFKFHLIVMSFTDTKQRHFSGTVQCSFTVYEAVDLLLQHETVHDYCKHQARAHTHTHTSDTFFETQRATAQMFWKIILHNFELLR